MKNKILTIAFLIMICGGLLLNVIIPDKDISTTERRTLTKFPSINIKGIISGEWMDDFEDYANDQFIARDFLGNVQNFMRTSLLKQKDVNNIFVQDGFIYKMDYKVNEKSLAHFVSCMENLKSMFSNNTMYMAIIPDKNYYLEDNSYLRLDYEYFYSYLDKNLDIEKIDIRNDLSLYSYYRTDLHWRQEELEGVAKKIASHYNVELNDDYTYEEYHHFYGAYASQCGQKIGPDTIVYMESDTLDNAVVTNHEKTEVKTVYDKEALSGIDSYDVYLSGATPLTVIENTNASTNKELIIFRDSFGSSFAPLLVEAYAKITLVDIRYMPSSMIQDYITIKDQDVLFLYSIPIINESFTLKK